MEPSLRPPTDKTYKKLTLVLVRKDDELLLGRKARGFGCGKWNGFGGKLESGESVEEAAKRELKEESGLSGELLKRAVLLFWFDSEEEKVLEIHLYECFNFTGEIQESEEMNPIKWFHHSSLPFSDMWPDDEIWMPKFISSDCLFRGNFHFSDLSTIAETDICETNSLDAFSK